MSCMRAAASPGSSLIRLVVVACLSSRNLLNLWNDNNARRHNRKSCSQNVISRLGMSKLHDHKPHDPISSCPSTINHPIQPYPCFSPPRLHISLSTTTISHRSHQPSPSRSLNFPLRSNHPPSALLRPLPKFNRTWRPPSTRTCGIANPKGKRQRRTIFSARRGEIRPQCKVIDGWDHDGVVLEGFGTSSVCVLSCTSPFLVSSPSSFPGGNVSSTTFINSSMA